MPLFKVYFDREVSETCSVVINAEDELHAEEIFNGGLYNRDSIRVEVGGSVLGYEDFIEAKPI
jgi:hypothetical protein